MIRSKICFVLIAVLALTTACKKTEFLNPLDPLSPNYNHLPVVKILTPTAGSIFRVGIPIIFIGEGTDFEEGDLDSTAFVWSSDIDGVLGIGEALVISSLSDNTHIITLTVTDSRTGTGISSVTIYVTDGNVQPVAEILSPPDNSIFFAGDTLKFKGTASDFEDGVLTGSSLIWLSNRDGLLGAGDSLTTTSISLNTHIISLIAADTEGYPDTSQITITMADTNRFPAACIIEPDDGSVFTLGETIEFSGIATDREDGDLTGSSLRWYSDVNGFLSTGESFTESGLSIAQHTILLVAADFEDNRDTAAVSITVEPPNQTPVAAIISPHNYDEFDIGANITFLGVGIDNEDGELSGSALVWESDKDGIIGTGQTFTRDDLSENVHTVGLTVTDSKGASDTAEILIEVRPDNTPPTASFTIAPSSGTVDTVFTFDASGSTDNETPIYLRFRWDWENDGVFDTELSTNPVATHQYPDSGLYSIKLFVADPGGLTDTVSQSLEVLLPDTSDTTFAMVLNNESEFNDKSEELLHNVPYYKSLSEQNYPRNNSSPDFALTFLDRKKLFNAPY
ncbi:hypothetical protein AMJ80_12180 [bacterium SM23_31]|nr:MAG: hypothetical protein AMJ80_12180 [bacterium SM23_31]